MKSITRYKPSGEITDKALAQMYLRIVIKKKKNVAEK